MAAYAHAGDVKARSGVGSDQSGTCLPVFATHRRFIDCEKNIQELKLMAVSFIEGPSVLLGLDGVREHIESLAG